MAPRKAKKMTEEDVALTFGPIPGIKIGKWWPSRKDCSADRVHPPFVAGIYGRQDDGARSIVLSGKSEFADEDHGDTFEYVGSGGRAPGRRFGPQTEDQTWDNKSNAALKRSVYTQKPIRVIRGAGPSTHAPYHGYRYDGLYTVTNPRMVTGPSGFKICKFDFTRLPYQDPLPIDRGPRDKSDIAARRRQYAHTIPRQKASGSRNRQTTSAKRGASSSPDDNDEDDDDNLEALFTAPEEVEEALEPVLPQLALFSRKSVTSAEKKQRKYLLLEIGRHIRSVIQEKRDEGGDYEWWRTELWKFVVDATPKKNHNYTIQQYEDLYEKFEMQESSSGGNDGTAVASGSGKMDLKVKGEPEEAVDYMSVDVKPKLESGS